VEPDGPPQLRPRGLGECPGAVQRQRGPPRRADRPARRRRPHRDGGLHRRGRLRRVRGQGAALAHRGHRGPHDHRDPAGLARPERRVRPAGHAAGAGRRRRHRV
ncbi:MAG: hypothetical protein AVDCRST_MAG41-363, partial [uncultured Corynebacteriales bacterium]